MHDAAATYPVPDYLTTGGRQAFDHEIARYARSIGAELDQLASGPLDRRDVPEHTAKDVAAARAAYESRFRSGSSDPDDPRELRQARASLLAAILLTISSVGVGVMPNFLGEPWQYALFAFLIAAGVVGLVLTWVGGTRAKRGSPPEQRNPDDDRARVNG